MPQSNQITQNIFKPIEDANIKEILKSLFEESDASGYIEAINHFVREKIEDANHEDLFNVYNIMKLTQTLAALEREYHKSLLHDN